MKKQIDLKIFENILGIDFKDKELLKRSLIHKSYLNENHDPKLQSNERLEFLGDAVLEIITTEYLFQTFPERNEGELTSFRSALVKTTTLSQTSTEIGVGDFIFMSNGEEVTGGRTRPYILANTFESVLGAIYLDQGYSQAKSFVYKWLLPKLDAIIEQRLDIDPKSKLQELSQEVLNFTPVYEMIKQTGPDHDKNFIMAVKIQNKIYAKGEGKSKQDAEQDAAEKALKLWSESNPSKA